MCCSIHSTFSIHRNSLRDSLYSSKANPHRRSHPTKLTMAPLSDTPYTRDSRKILALFIGYSLFFAVVLWAAYNNKLPLQSWLFQQLPYYDKIGHVVLYCVPTYLGHRLLRYKHWQVLGTAMPTFPLLFGLFTLSEELTQGFAPHRTLDLGDLICSIAGILVGYWLSQRRQTSPT